MKKILFLLVIVAFLVIGISYVWPVFFQIQSEPLSEDEILAMLGSGGEFGDAEDVRGSVSGTDAATTSPVSASGADTVGPLLTAVSEIFVPKFHAVEVSFQHSWSKKSLPLTGGALIDIDNDGVQEIFVAGGMSQDDALFHFQKAEPGNGEKADFFEKIIEASGDIAQKPLVEGIKQTTYGATAADIDKNGWTDLLVAREDGVYLYLNKEGKFFGKKLDISIEEKAVPVAITAGDINNDGLPDLYVSTFINAGDFRSATFNDPAHVTRNFLLLNKGNNEFEDVSDAAGVTFAQNTFLAEFADLNNDGWQDLVIVPNTDKPRIYKNNGDLTFREVRVPLEYGFWMGLAIGDIDNDSDLDIFLSNIGNTVPMNFALGDLRSEQKLDPEWALLRNTGAMQFEQVNHDYSLTGFEFAWGAVFSDFNRDGRLDLYVMENYIKWPAHWFDKLPGRFLIQGMDNIFVPAENVAGIENKYYGMTPLVADFDKNGYPDLVLINLDGPLRIFLNEGEKN